MAEAAAPRALAAPTTGAEPEPREGSTPRRGRGTRGGGNRGGGTRGGGGGGGRRPHRGGGEAGEGTRPQASANSSAQTAGPAMTAGSAPSERAQNNATTGNRSQQPGDNTRGGQGRRQGGRGGRPPRRGANVSAGGRPARTTIGAVPRSFGGHLTSDAGSGAGDNDSLNVDAEEFVPGQAVKAKYVPPHHLRDISVYCGTDIMVTAARRPPPNQRLLPLVGCQDRRRLIYQHESTRT